jgi:hypothetical protein
MVGLGLGLLYELERTWKDAIAMQFIVVFARKDCRKSRILFVTAVGVPAEI